MRPRLWKFILWSRKGTIQFQRYQHIISSIKPKNSWHNLLKNYTTSNRDESWIIYRWINFATTKGKSQFLRQNIFLQIKRLKKWHKKYSSYVEFCIKLKEKGMVWKQLICKSQIFQKLKLYLFYIRKYLIFIWAWVKILWNTCKA